MKTQANAARILAVDQDASTCELLRQVLSKEGHQVLIAHSAEEAFKIGLPQQPHVVISEISLPGIDGFAFCRKLKENGATRSIPVLFLSSQDGVANKVKGFEAGADDYTLKPFEPEELRYRVKILLARSRVQVEPKSNGRMPGKTIVFFGSKGGVGKTSVALNLALAMQKRANGGRKIALFDADFDFGDIGARLNLPTSRSVIDLARNAEHLDAELIQQVMISHSSGLRVLLNPVHPVEAEFITGEHIKKVMTQLTCLYDTLIVDCQSSYDERTLAVLDRADLLLLVVTPEIGPIKNAAQFLELSEDLGIPPDKVFVVLNRFNSNVGIEPTEIERTYKRKIAFHLASAGRMITMCTNQGMPLFLVQPNHTFSQQILQMADHLTKRLGQE